ncbi:sensor histidine kinase [Spirosoma areae]
MGTILLLALGTFVTVLLFIYKNRYLRYQQHLSSLEQTYQRELLQTQLETQNQTLEYIGQELHDNVGQMLSVAMLQLNGLDEDLSDPSHQSAVRQMIETVQSTIQAVRQLAKTLDSGTVRRFGLRESLALELERIGQTGRYQTHLDITGQPYDLGDEAEIILFRMAQESLNNALKHAQAKTLTVTVDYQLERFMLSIADDGRGFDLAEATNRQATASGSGVNNLYQRAQLLGGTCTISTQANTGTRIGITLPRQPTK